MRALVRRTALALAAAWLGGCTQDFNALLPGDAGAPDVGMDVVCTDGASVCSGTCTALDSDPNHCGTCTTVCNQPGAMHACNAGVCSTACAAGFSDCDMDPSTGCEVATGTDLLNCGACNMPCTLQSNAEIGCARSMCNYTCHTGFGDCITALTDGCETRLASDPNHCGVCGTACAADQACVGGMCTSGDVSSDAGAYDAGVEGYDAAGTDAAIEQSDGGVSVLSPCDGTTVGVGRDCGWRVGGRYDCVPNAVLNVGCSPTCAPALGTCTGDTMIRVCTGDAACNNADAIGANDDSPCGGGTFCSSTRILCPPAGRFTVLTASWDSAAYTCTLAVQ